jgi:hypothetical protein
MQRTKSFRFCFVILSGLTLVSSLTSFSGMVISESRDSPGPVQPFPSSGTATGWLNKTPNSSDYFYKDFLGGETITLTINNSPYSDGNISVTISIPNSTIELRSTSIAPGEVQKMSFVSNETTVGRSVMNISIVSGSTAKYTIVEKFSPQNDDGLGKDASGSSCCAVSLTGTNLSINGDIGPGDEKQGIDKNDMYTFWVPPLHDIILSGTSNSSKSDIWVELHQNSIKVLPFFRGFLSQTSPLNVIVHGGKDGSRFYLNVDWENGPQTAYHIDVELRKTPDSVAPKLELDPVPALVRNKTLNITGNSTDDRSVDRIEVSLNSGPPSVCSGTSPWKCTLSLFEGQNLILVVAVDKAENKATSTQTVTYLPQQIGPLGIDIKIDEPAQGGTVEGEKIQLKGTINRTDGRTTINCSVDGGLTWFPAKLEGSSWSCQAPLNNKMNTIIVKAIHSDGSQDQSSITVYRKNPETGSSKIGTPQEADAILLMVLIIAALIIVNEMKKNE